MNDAAYLSSTVSFGGVSGSSNPNDAQQIVNRYPAGKVVPVYYDPSDSQVATLEPGASWGNYFVLGLGVLLLIVGLSWVVRSIVLLVRETAKRFRAACTPDFYLFDGDRRLVYRGQLDDSRPKNEIPVTGRDLRAAIDAVLEEGEVPTEQRSSLGCNIKWKPGNAPQYSGTI